MEKERYLAELSSLLGFMSAWDRKAVMAKYAAEFDAAEDIEALIERLGTPTRVAVVLAQDYVASPPPEEDDSAPVREHRELAEPLDRMFAEAEAVPPPAPEPEAEQRTPRRLRPGGVVASVLFTLCVGIPVAAVLICVGVPFLSVGLALIGRALWELPAALTSFNLLSDVLLVLGAVAGLLALGLLLAWLGLWISVSLSRLWIGGVVLRLDARLSRGKED